MRVVGVLGGDEHPSMACAIEARLRTRLSSSPMPAVVPPAVRSVPPGRAMAATGPWWDRSHRPRMVIIREGTMRAAKGGRQGEP